MSGKKNKRKRREERQEKSANPSSSSSSGDVFVESNYSKGKRSRNDTYSGIDAQAGSRMDKCSKKNADNSKCLIFQDVMKRFLDPTTATPKSDNTNTNDEEQEDRDGEISNIMFELANSPLVGYRVKPSTQKKKKIATNSSSNKSTTTIVVQQDINAKTHTGGIVWETAYLLLQYLQTRDHLGKTLEVGAGCGMLGQVLAAQNLSDNVVMTEHEEVMQLLKSNLERNQTQQQRPNDNDNDAPIIHACALDWEQFERDVDASKHILEPHTCDTVVGTDVVFSPKLVEPLWRCLQYMSHSKTNIYLCLQERCAASHKLLLEKASDYGFVLQDITRQFDDIPTCRWGTSLECRLFHITLLP